MKKSILQAVFEGDILPWELKYKRGTPENMELFHLLEAERAYFESSMTPEDKSRFDAYHSLYLSCIAEENDHGQYQSFLLGMCMGMDLMMEKNVMV